MKKLFISDTHFNHAKIISLANRPFTDVDHMNYTMTTNWNSAVGNDDVVYFLGDFAWKYHANFFYKLNGRKIFIRGNHDDAVENLPWEEKHDYLEVSDDIFGKIVLFHYPIAEWNGMFKGAYHFYGHVHNADLHMPINWKARAFDVGAEALDYTPRTAEEIVMKGNR